jgi:hypothetical protein
MAGPGKPNRTMNRLDVKSVMQPAKPAERRLGKFKVSGDFFRDGKWPCLLDLMQHMVVVRAECDWNADVHEYTAFSHLFEPTPWPVEVPEYEIKCERIHDGSLVFTAERQTAEWHDRKRAEWEATFGLAGNVPVGPSVATAGPEIGCWLRRMWNRWTKGQQ